MIKQKHNITTVYANKKKIHSIHKQGILADRDGNYKNKSNTNARNKTT